MSTVHKENHKIVICRIR
ncbi:hypothetical protein YPPY102_2277, partial [Yersinia pestis PY-102]